MVKEKLAGLADRVIMNLPETANEFVGAACQTIKPSGGIIHFYGFARRPQTLNDLKKEFRELVGNAGRKVDKFRYLGNVRETAPYEYQIVLDAKIS